MEGPPPSRPKSTAWRDTIALFLVVFSVYALTSPGRFDTIDTQWRYEVATSLLVRRSTAVRDPAVIRTGIGAMGPDGQWYATHSVGGSIGGMPALVAARAIGRGGTELERFLYTLCNAVYGALTAVVLLGFYRDLGLSRRRALIWSLIAAFASMLWPMSATSLDNVQHALLMLGVLRIARSAALRDSLPRAAGAGLLAGFLVLHQPAFVVVLPTLSLAVLSSGLSALDRPAALRRVVGFAAASSLGVVTWLGYNLLRFGAPFGPTARPSPVMNHPPLLGNPLVGAVSLLVSPGKSVFLYSPTVLLGLIGLRFLWRRERSLALAIAATCAVHFTLISSLTFFGGDWCWGPRYLGCLTVILAVAAPFATEKVRPFVVRLLVLAGLCVQLLAISTDHAVFFMNHRLPIYFWYEDKWFYFRASQCFERPHEAASLYWRTKPPRARLFGPSIHPGSPTSALMGPAAPERLPEVLPWFLVYQVPRPWPFWAPRVTRPMRPVPTAPVVFTLLGLGLLGAFSLGRTLRDETTGD